MSEQQKAAMANGRAESSAIKRYLEISRGKSGRPVTAASVGKQLERTRSKLAGTRDELTRLRLTADRMRLERDLKRLEKNESAPAMQAARAAFIANAKTYGERHGIPRAAWKAMGIDPATMAEAGL